MRQELKNAFGRVFLTIDVDTQNKWIHVCWMGYLTADNVKLGAETYIEVLQKSGLNCILSDSRLILGTWDHSMEWLLKEWAPKATNAGLQYIAMITAPESLGDSSASKFHKELNPFETQLFDSRPEAENWLKRYSLKSIV